MSEFYVWDIEEEAINALNYINNTIWLPLVGRNALTGELEPYKQKMENWCEDPIQRDLDGKFVVPRIPKNILDYANVSVEDQLYFLNTYHPIIEEYQDDWFDNVGEEE